MASKRSRSGRAASRTQEIEGVEPSDAPHPLDDRIYADGRPKLTNGNPHAPNTAAFLAWEEGYRPGFASEASDEGAESETEL